MRTVKDWQERLLNQKEDDLIHRLEKDDKVHLLYISPKLNATGYYRTIAPALELNKTTTHKAILTSIEKNNFTMSFDDYASISEALIQWADYIISPSVFSDLGYLIKAIQTINSGVQLVIDIDKNYFEIPKDSPLKKKITNLHLELFKSNMAMMDFITCSNVSLVKYLRTLVLKNTSDKKLVYYIPSLISAFGYEEMPLLKKNKSNAIRIGLIKPIENMLSLKEVLLKIKASFKEEIEFVCLGIPHYSKEVDKLLKKLEVELHDTVGFTDYFKKLNDLELDFAILPAKGGDKNTCKNSHLFMELSAFGIPVITSKNHSASKFIKDSKNGWVVADDLDWEAPINQFIKNKKLREELGKNALNKVWKTQSFTPRNIAVIQDIFI